MTRQTPRVHQAAAPCDSESDLERLLAIMSRLRDPVTGCPWDVRQTFQSIAPHTLEEAYEVVDALRSGDRSAIKDELGDLLLQVVFLAQIAREEKSFTFNDIVVTLADKLVRRHPHVFGSAQADTPEAVATVWQSVKDSENDKSPSSSMLDGVGHGLPALLRALKLQKRAITARWDWPDAAAVLDKLDEEVVELREALASGDKDAVEDELGDAFFVLVNVARKSGLDSEMALLRACEKFEARFRCMEADLKAEGHSQIETLDEETMNRAWKRVKESLGKAPDFPP